MASNTVFNEMMNFYETSMNTYYNGCLDVHRQVMDFINDLLPGISVYHTEQEKTLYYEWTKAFGNGIDAMQKNYAELLEEMNPDRIFKKRVEDMRRQFGIASREETTILFDQLEHLKAQIADLRSRNRIQEIIKDIERNGDFVAQEDLKPLKKSLSDLDGRIDSLGDVKSLQEAVSQLENGLSHHVDEIAQIKQLVVKINPQISMLADKIDRLSGRMGNSTSISVE